MHAVHQLQPRTALLEALIAHAGLQGSDSPELAAVATRARVPLPVAQEMFGDVASLRAEVPRYLQRRRLEFIRQGIGPVAEDACCDVAADLADMAEGYFAYYQQDLKLAPVLFAGNESLSQQSLEAARDGSAHTGNEWVDSLMRTARCVANKEGSEVGVDLKPNDLANQAIAAWGTVHGLAYLSTCGVLRFQHKVVRRYNFREVVEAMLAVVRSNFLRGETTTISPWFGRLAPIAERSTVYAVKSLRGAELSAAPVDIARQEILHAAAVLAGQRGVEEVTLASMATLLDVEVDYVNSLFDNDFDLRDDAEVTIDEEVNDVIEQVVRHMPADATSNDLLHAMSVGYFHYAISFPDRFRAAIALGSGSVVPLGGQGRSHAAMGASMAALTDVARGCIEELGAEPEDQLVYIKTLTLWAGCAGIAHLCSSGELRDLTAETKWQLFAEVVETVVDSFEFSFVHGGKPAAS